METKQRSEKEIHKFRDSKGRTASFDAEKDSGNVEYKRALLSDDFERIDRLTTQLSYRLAEGNGVAQYRIGIEDDGCLSFLTFDEMEKSLLQLELMVESISAVITSVEKVSYHNDDLYLIHI